MISSYGTDTDSVCRNADVICRTLDVTGGTETVHQRNYSRLPRPVRIELKRIKLVIQMRGRRNKKQYTTDNQEEMVSSVHLNKLDAVCVLAAFK
jgi:hypothetical protein